LFAAVEADDSTALAALLAKPETGGPDARGPYGLTPLMRAAQKGSARAVEILLARGAAADATDEAGNTALMYAAARGQRACAEKLLAAGASKSHRNKFGLGPVDWAVWPKDGRDLRDLVQD
jgi:ankyrin repeat protein